MCQDDPALSTISELYLSACGTYAHLHLHDDFGRARKLAISRADIQRAALAEVSICVMSHGNGDIFAAPSGLDDDVIGELFDTNRIVTTPIDEIVVASFALLMNERPHEARRELQRLRQRLVTAVKATEAQIADVNLALMAESAIDGPKSSADH